MWHPMLLMCADHLPQQVSRPPCGTPCGTLPQQVLLTPCCVLTTFRNRCVGHHVAHFRNRCLLWHTVLLVRADHLPQQVWPPCGTLCCSCVLTTCNRCLGHHVAHCAAHVC